MPRPRNLADVLANTLGQYSQTAVPVAQQAYKNRMYEQEQTRKARNDDLNRTLQLARLQIQAGQYGLAQKREKRLEAEANKPDEPGSLQGLLASLFNKGDSAGVDDVLDLTRRFHEAGRKPDNKKVGVKKFGMPEALQELNSMLDAIAGDQVTEAKYYKGLEVPDAEVAEQLGYQRYIGYDPVKRFESVVAPQLKAGSFEGDQLNQVLDAYLRAMPELGASIGNMRGPAPQGEMQGPPDMGAEPVLKNEKAMAEMFQSGEMDSTKVDSVYALLIKEIQDPSSPNYISDLQEQLDKEGGQRKVEQLLSNMFMRMMTKYAETGRTQQ